MSCNTGNADGAGGLMKVLAEWVKSTDGTSPGTAFSHDLAPTAHFDSATRDTEDDWTRLSTEAEYIDGTGHDTTKTNLCVE